MSDADDTLTLRRADDGTLGYVERLLETNGLPSRDVREKADCFYVGYRDVGNVDDDGDDPVGVGGVEPHGTDGLLRSVVVEESMRGRGFGAALCDALEATASAEGVTSLYLLTTTAAGFFADRGYVEVERSDAPAAIRRTTEFEDLCPASATPMRKRL